MSDGIYPNPIDPTIQRDREVKPKSKKPFSCWRACGILLAIIVLIILFEIGKTAYYSVTSTSYTHEYQGNRIYSLKYSNKYYRGSLGTEVRIWNRTPLKLTCFFPDAMCGGAVFLALKLIPRDGNAYESPLAEYNSKLESYRRIKEMPGTTFKGQAAYKIPGGVLIFKENYMLAITPTTESEAGLNSWDPALINNLVIY